MATLPAKNQALELIRLRVQPQNLAAFLEGREKVDAFVRTIAGHLGTEIVSLPNHEFLMLIRWESKEIVAQAQKITETSSIISDWIARTAEFVAFETSEVVYTF